MIVTKDLKKHFAGHEVLRGISQHIVKGEKVVIIGPSGSGKSTLLYTLSGMDKMTSGSVIFDGDEFKKMTPC